jgi:hypothetical protein
MANAKTGSMEVRTQRSALSSERPSQFTQASPLKRAPGPRLMSMIRRSMN